MRRAERCPLGPTLPQPLPCSREGRNSDGRRKDQNEAVTENSAVDPAIELPSLVEEKFGSI